MGLGAAGVVRAQGREVRQPGVVQSQRGPGGENVVIGLCGLHKRVHYRVQLLSIAVA
jgi:hypothetical protein